MEKTYLVNACSCWGKGEWLTQAMENWAKEYTSLGRGEPRQDAQMEVIILTCEPDKVEIGGMGFNFPPEALTYSRLLPIPEYQYIRAYGSALLDADLAMIDMIEPIQSKVDEIEAECGL